MLGKTKKEIGDKREALLVQSLAMSFAPGLLRISGLVHHNAQVGM